MELKDVQEFIKTNAEKEEVKNYIRGFTTPDGVKAYLDSEDGGRLIQPKLDQHFTRSLETWKANNLQKLIDEEVNKAVQAKYPKETEEQKRLHKLESDLQAETQKRQQAELLMSAVTEATAKGLPTDLIRFFVGKDADSTKANLQEYEKAMRDLEKRVSENFLKKYGRTPDVIDQAEQGLFTKAEVERMSQVEVMKNLDKIHKSMSKW